MTEEAHRLLGRIGDEWGISENQAAERAIREAHTNMVQKESTDEPPEELLGELREQVGYLREQLRIRDEEIRRRDHILAASLERIPAISAESRESEATGADLRASEETPKGRAWWKIW